MVRGEYLGSEHCVYNLTRDRLHYKGMQTEYRMKLIKWIFVCILCLFVSACRISADPFSSCESYQKARCEIKQMFACQQPICGDKLDFNQAMARGLQYNLDNRVKQTNIALKSGEMKMAELSMLPIFSASGSVYNRNNDNATFGSNPNGTPSDVIAFGADRTLRSSRFALKWNLIDLGMGYVKTREQGERLLIAEEESRQQLQKLVQDIQIAYLNAYYAQQLDSELKAFHQTLDGTNDLLNKALLDKTIPKNDLLNFQAILLEGNRRLVQLEERLRKAELVFKYLINFPANEPLVLKKPPVKLTKIQNLKNLDFEKLDAITLVKRPELRSQGYQRRIAELGTKTAIFQALPVVTINKGRNHDSNSFLVNNFWSDQSIEAYWNIVNLASLPVSLRNVRVQKEYEKLKWMALTLGALNETRIAYARYQNLAKESRVAHQQTVNATRFYTLSKDREAASLASKQQVVLAKLYMLYARIDEILLLSDLAAALGQLYLASGFDVLPLDAALCASSEEVLCIIQDNLAMQEKLGFKGYVKATYDGLFNTKSCCN